MVSFARTRLRAKGAIVAKKPTTPFVLTSERAARLIRLVTILGEKPHTRATISRRLGVTIRSLYRYLEVLRSVGIEVELDDGRYVLVQEPRDALARLPFPDPCLTLGEVEALARGRTAAHRKLAQLLARVKNQGGAKERSRRQVNG